MKKRTRRRPAVLLQLRQPLHRRQPLVPRQLQSVPTPRSHPCTYRPSATIPSLELYDMRNNHGDTPLMHLVPSTISTPPHRPITICLLRGNASLRCPSGRQAVASTSLTLMVVVTKVSPSRTVGTTPMVLHVGSSPCPTSEEKSVARLSPRRPVSPTKRTAYEITHPSQCPAHPTRLQVLCPVSNNLFLINFFVYNQLRAHVF